MKIKVNDKVYDAPSNVEVKLTKGEVTKTLKMRYTRVNYYAEKYGDGKCVHLEKVVGAALGESVEIEVVSDKEGLVAQCGDYRILVPKISAPKPKKKKSEKVKVDTAEIKAESDPLSEDSE